MEGDLGSGLSPALARLLQRILGNALRILLRPGKAFAPDFELRKCPTAR